MAVTLPKDAVSNKFPNLGSVVSAALPYVYVIAGLAMLLMIISGGITLMTAAGDPAKSKSGYGQVTAGIVGFIIIFVAYFVAQIVQVVFGVKFL
jgi:hypothetical protein